MRQRIQKLQEACQLVDDVGTILSSLDDKRKRLEGICHKILLKEKEVSFLLHLSPQILSQWRIRGKGPRYYKIEGCIRYDYFDLISYIDRCLSYSTSEND